MFPAVINNEGGSRSLHHLIEFESQVQLQQLNRTVLDFSPSLRIGNTRFDLGLRLLHSSQAIGLLEIE